MWGRVVARRWGGPAGRQVVDKLLVALDTACATGKLTCVNGEICRMTRTYASLLIHGRARAAAGQARVAKVLGMTVKEAFGEEE